MTVKVTTRSPEETFSAGESLGRSLVGGELILLAGGLGSGKTVFTKGISRGLGIEDVVTSPSFTVMNIYEGIRSLCHFDFYRIDRRAEMEDLIEDFIYRIDTVVVVEWGEKLSTILEPVIFVRFEIDGDDRIIAVERRGC